MHLMTDTCSHNVGLRGAPTYPPAIDASCWAGLGGKPESTSDRSRLIHYVHLPIDARLPISIQSPDKLVARCYRLPPHPASSSRRSIPSSAGLTRSPWTIWKKNLGMQFSTAFPSKLWPETSSARHRPPGLAELMFSFPITWEHKL